MIILSMSSGIVPLDLKSSFITPILKKSTLDNTVVNRYRPISNLSVISKLLEEAVCSQLVCYLDANSLMPRNQSAYRRHHSTEYALTVVFSYIIQALDSEGVVLLSLLDLSAAAFDCVDHDILLARLRQSHGFDSSVNMTGCHLT